MNMTRLMGAVRTDCSWLIAAIAPIVSEITQYRHCQPKRISIPGIDLRSNSGIFNTDFGKYTPKS